MTRFRSYRAFPVLISAFCVAGLLGGCSSRPSAAQKLFAKREYQKVIENYPDLEIARRAEAKLAEQLFEAKQYDTVIRQYPQTPAAYKAKLAQAQQLFDAGNYVAVIDSFSYLPLAAQARERMADLLFNSGQFDDLIMRYPDSPKARELKEKRAQEALAEAKNKRGEARRQALQEIMRLYGGTTAYKEAAELHARTRAPQK